MPIWDDPRNKLNAGLLQPVLPNQIGVPDRNQRLPFGEIQTPERELKDVTPPEMPFFKDKNKMAMMLSVLSNGFGNMTLRGNSGLKQMNNAIYAQAAQKEKENKTMQYLAGHNPDMYRILQKLPADQRGDYMKLAMQSKFKGLTGENSTADIRNFEYFNSLDEEGQRQFLGLKRGDQMVKGPDGSAAVRYADGRTEWIITPEQAAAGTYAAKSATDVAASDSERIQKLSSAAKNAANSIPLLEEELALAMDPDRAEGAFASLEKMYNALQAELSDEYGTDLSGATKDQLLQAGAARRVMNWFKDSGLGARGMDTPAEYNRLLEAFGGMKEMTPQAYATLLKRLIREKQRAVEDYNDALSSGRYSEVYNSDFYEPRETPWLNAVPELPPGFVVKGTQ